MEKHGILYKSLQGAAMGASFWIALLAVWAAYASWGILTQVNTVGTGSGLSSIEWNKMVTDLGTIDSKLAAVVPTGWVMAFVGTSCPVGWSSADGTPNGVKKTDGSPTTLDLRWEFIRGLDGGRGVDAWRWLATAQNATRVFQYNSTNIGYNGGLWDHDHVVSADFDGASESVSGGAYSAATSGGAISSWTVYGVRVRPRNVALLYCVKN